MDVYQYAQDNIEAGERDKFIKERYELCIKNLKKYVVCREMNIITNSMTYVFEHIKDALIEVIATFIHPNKRERLSSKEWGSIEYRKYLLDILVDLGYRSIILWFFLYTNYFNHDDLDNQRKSILENIELLSEFYPHKMYFESADELYWACPITNLLFSISYQNRNNKVILQNYCSLMRKLCPSLNYDVVTRKSHPKNPKIRVLFISEFLTMDSSVLRDRMGVMVKLPRTKFDIFYAAYTDKDKIYGSVSKHVYQIIGKNYIQLGDEIVENRNKIARHNFDIIVYCELGMRMRPYWLSYSRLAPVQLTTWGHSETSGVDTIDYFVSSKYFEHEKAQNHYSEQLVKMDSLSTYYFPPSQILINNFKYQTRKDLGLDDNINLYGCIQSSFKISKQFEMILYHILEKDKNGYILMSHSKPFCKSQMDRMYETFGEEKFRRLVFYPGLNINNYLNLVKIIDVMLDPYPFGGCNTSYEAFDYDIPVVTLPTRFLNGRFTFGLYKKMGFIDMISTTADNYVKLAVKCGTDKQFRQSISDKIKENKYSIFMEEESVQEWTKFLEEKAINN
jgi:predicted O-linked N-acetylglucosamine transferase (SPINDLY family)